MGPQTYSERPDIMVRDFQYRSPRLRTQFRVDFFSAGLRHSGECTDLSPDGLRARLTAELAAGTEGWLELHLSDRVYRVEAVVANYEHDDAGFCFRARTPEESLALRTLVSEVGGLSWVE